MTQLSVEISAPSVGNTIWMAGFSRWARAISALQTAPSVQSPLMRADLGLSES